MKLLRASPCCWIISDGLNTFAQYIHVNNLYNKISTLNIVCFCCLQDLVPLITSKSKIYFLNKKKSGPLYTKK